MPSGAEKKLSFPSLLDLSAAVDAVWAGYKAFKGYRLLAFGAQNVGKSTLWSYLESGKAGVTIEKTMTPTGIGTDPDNPKFRLRDIKAAWVRVAIKATDVPGDPDLRSCWADVLARVEPRGIIFLVDHDSSRSAVEGGYNPQRMAEHDEAFSHLRDLVLGIPGVQEKLRSLFIVANKHDVWHNQMSYGQLLQATNIYDLVGPLGGLRELSIRYNYCSALSGDNVTEMMRAVIGDL